MDENRRPGGVSISHHQHERNLMKLLESWDYVKKRMAMESNARLRLRMKGMRYREIVRTARVTTVEDVIRLQEQVTRLQETNARLMFHMNQLRQQLTHMDITSCSRTSSVS